ncbi:MAG: arsenic efflux protein [Kiritimatiellae bacterium]|nr:arsenic efflux protein [Kiritimatiellia bacterium]
MIHFLEETLLLLPFLFATYLALETLESKAGGALEKLLGRVRLFGPLVGSAAGAIPQCGVAAAAASLYAGGVITAGALVAVFLSTSDELLPVLISERVAFPILAKILVIKLVSGVFVGFALNAILRLLKRKRRPVSVGELCEHSHCGCSKHKGIVVPALIHTAEIFLFIVVVSGLIELCMHFFGEDALLSLRLTKPVVGELIAGVLGLVPNCAVSVAAAKLYLAGGMSAGALIASSLTGSGLGFLVLFRTNRNLKENLCVLAVVYVSGVLLGMLFGRFL